VGLLYFSPCCVRFGVIRGADGAFGTEFLDLPEVRATLRDLLHRGNALFAAYAVPERDVTD